MTIKQEIEVTLANLHSNLDRISYEAKRETELILDMCKDMDRMRTSVSKMIQDIREINQMIGGYHEPRSH